MNKFIYGLRVLIAFTVSATIGAVFASILHTQFVLAGLVALDIDIPFYIRMQTTWHDILSLAVPKSLISYGAIIMIGLGIAFASMAILRFYIKSCSRIVYPIGGVIAMIVGLVAMHQIFEVALIAGARSILGFSAQCLAGALAGCIFAYLLKWTKLNK